MSNSLLQSWARALGGEVSGSNVLCPGPSHGANDRSLSVQAAGASPDGFIVHSFSDDDWRECHAFVCSKLGRAPFKPGQYEARATREKPVIAKTRDNSDAALNIWQEAVSPRGTLVEAYLNSRCLDLPDEAAGDAIRFHPHCPFGGARHPAMICLVRNVLTNEPQAIHRTALTPDGPAIKHDGKTFRLTLGTIAGGAIKLTPDEDVGQGLCVGEGTETCLAARVLGFRPVWSLVNAGGIANFPVLDGIEGLTVFAEADEPSRKAVQKCFKRWSDAGRTVVVQKSTVGSDINDAIRGAL
jgi:putative DNA primase/helicase